MVHPPLHFDEAIAWFRERVPMTDEDFDALESEVRQRAFTVGGVAHLDVVTEAWEAIDEAIAEGTTLDDFQAAIGPKLTSAWGSEQPWRVEMILRTNVQQAYSAGRWEQQQAVSDDRPFWEFSAILDMRNVTCPICPPRDGTVKAADDPWWRTNNPPLHPDCRCTVLSLTAEQAKERGVDAGQPPGDPASDGFGLAPGDVGEWEPSGTDYPGELAHEARAKGVF